MSKETGDVLADMDDKAKNELSKIFLTEMPFSIHVYYFLKVCSEWRSKDATIDVRFLYHKDEIESGIFVGLLKSGSKSITVFVYCLKGHETLLKNVLIATNLIPWNQLPMFQSILYRCCDVMEQVIKEKGFEPVVMYDTAILAISIDDALNLQINIPDDVYIAPLKRSHAEIMYSIWMLRNIYTIEDLENSIELNFGYGIFSKNNDDLLSWAVEAHYGGIAALQTKQDQKRKGYAKLLSEYVSKKLAGMSIIPHVVVQPTNIPSTSLFNSVGYKQIAPVKYFKVSRLS